MKRITIFVLLLLAAAISRAELWTDDYYQGLTDAAKSNKHVLLNFTGSDWCGWCKKLDAEVFAQQEFKDFAAANLVCITIDFPRQKKLAPVVEQRNHKLQERFAVTGYPTIFILDPKEQIIARTGYQRGGAQAYVDHLKKFIDAASTPAK